MKCFEVTLKGFDPDNSDTDHLVKWVIAPDLEILVAWLNRMGLEDFLDEPPWGMGEHASAYTFKDGVEVIIYSNGNAEFGEGSIGEGSIALWKEEVKTQEAKIKEQCTLAGKCIHDTYKLIPLEKIVGKTVEAVVESTVEGQFWDEPCIWLHFTDGTKHGFVLAVDS